MRNLATLFIIVLVFSIIGCGGDGSVPLTGEYAYDYIRKDRSDQPSTDVEAIRSVMDWAIDDAVARKSGKANFKDGSVSRVEPPANVMKLLKKTTKPRKNFVPDRFERLTPGYFTDNNPPVKSGPPVLHANDLNMKHDEFYIDNLDVVPVRNQGYRGTCAAFTGIGNIEYATLKSYPGEVSSIDLSEQRFYYLSKPECQSSGCSLSEEGSWYGTGMEASLNNKDLIIPLETDCPYNSSRGSNDLQTPQIGSCSTGSAKVMQLKTVNGAQAIINALETNKVAIPFASPLSGNWERNKGLITYEGSNHPGNSNHAGGHAYLIVGYKKVSGLPESEGGM